MKFNLVILFCVLTNLALAQNKSDSLWLPKSKFELNLNVTSTLSNALGNTNNSGLLLDPYLFGLKYKIKKAIYFRSAFNVRSKDVSENLGQRTVAEGDYRIRVGVEKRIQATAKFAMYAGVDLVGGYNTSNVTTSDFFGGFSRLKTTQTSYGGGPVMGFMYRINKRIYLSTEASLTYYFIENYRYLNIGFPDPNPIETRSKGYILSPVIPSSLYVNINF